VIDFEFLRGRQNETVLKELCVASATSSETYRFKGHYKLADNGSSENGIHWDDGHIEYKELHSVVAEAVADFSPLRLRRLESHVPLNPLGTYYP